MRIGNKLFPYPLLNNDKLLSGYKESSLFELKVDVDDNGSLPVINGNIVLKNLHFELNNDNLEALLAEGRIAGKLIVECSSTTYRSNFDISTIPYTLTIPAMKFNGVAFFSAYLYATEDISGFCSNEFQEDYEGYKFYIDKFDILAADDGFKVNFEIDTSEDSGPSIFQIVKKINEDNLMTCENGDKYITIQLPESKYKSYETMIKPNSTYNNISFAMIAIPALVYCIDDIMCTQYDSMEEIIAEHHWFEAVCNAYKRETKKDLIFEQLDSYSSLELAQIVLNNAICNGIADFDSLIIGAESDGGDEDE